MLHQKINKMKPKIYFLIIAYIGFCIQNIIAQKIEINGDINAAGFVSAEETLPFWLYSNTTSQVDSETNFATNGGINATYFFKNNNFLEVGSRLQYNNGIDPELKRNELYVKFGTPSFSITAGAKAEEELQYGLSTSNRNFHISRNARPFPGVRLKTEKPVKITNHWNFEGELAHYKLNDTRIVDGARVHHKMLKINYTVVKDHQFSFALRHYAMWGGTSELTGRKQPNSLSDFFRIFIAQRGDEEASSNDQLNALGNHLGSYTISYDFNTEAGNFSLYHIHPFEDGSGTTFKNFPDGIWGLYLAPDEVWAVKGILYEFVDTSDQSGALGRSGRDNYFNNRIYRSGWTYDSNIIGLPYIRLGNTRVTAHHLGVFLKLKQFDITSKVSYIENKGTYFAPLNPTQKGFYTMVNTTYNTTNFGSISLLAGYDALSNIENNLGIGIQYSYHLD